MYYENCISEEKGEINKIFTKKKEKGKSIEEN